MCRLRSMILCCSRLRAAHSISFMMFLSNQERCAICLVVIDPHFLFGYLAMFLEKLYVWFLHTLLLYVGRPSAIVNVFQNFCGRTCCGIDVRPERVQICVGGVLRRVSHFVGICTIPKTDAVSPLFQGASEKSQIWFCVYRL